MTSTIGTSLEDRVAWLVDRAQIHDLVVSYARAADTKDWKGYSDLFTDDGRILGPAGEVPKKDIENAIEHLLSPFQATQHMLTNIGITIDGDTARSNHYLQATHLPQASDPGQHADIGGWYDNEYRRTPEGWRFVTLDLTFVWTDGLPFAPEEPTG